jgi:DNA-binding XRE family transcriptional regulator
MASAVFYSSEIDKAPVALQRRGQYVEHRQDIRSHRAVPFVSQNPTKGSPMSCGSISRPLRERVKAALQRRLFPHTHLTQKVLAKSVGLSDGTIANLLSGNNDPSGRVLDILVAFFRDGFINEVWGAHNIHCIDTRAAQKAVLVAQVVAAQAELRRLG